MPELLLQGKSHPGPAQPKRGDIREAESDGHRWGRLEDKRRFVAEGGEPDDFPDDFLVLHVRGLSLDRIRRMFRQGRREMRDARVGDPEWEIWFEMGADPNVTPQVKVARYRWRVNISELPASARAALRDDGYASVTDAEFVAASEHKAKRVRFDKDHPDGEGAARPEGAG